MDTNKLNPLEVRRILDDIIAKETDPDQIAKLEVAREFWTNQAFRAQMFKISYEQVMAAAEPDDRPVIS